MARDYNYYFYAGADNKRPAFSGSNGIKSKSSLNSSFFSKQDTGGSIRNSNLKRLLNAGLFFNTIQKGNETLGAYTNNSLRQRRIDTSMTFGKYGLGLMVNAPAGAIYAVSDLGYRALQYGIRVQKGNRQANYYVRLSGNNSFSGSRYRSDYV